MCRCASFGKRSEGLLPGGQAICPHDLHLTDRNDVFARCKEALFECRAGLSRQPVETLLFELNRLLNSGVKSKMFSDGENKIDFVTDCL